jgi:hypothetical protein
MSRTSDLQFGFEKDHSTSVCTIVLKETLDYYRTNGNDVYRTMLDATIKHLTASNIANLFACYQLKTYLLL